jgi:hypothetical protein
MCNGPFEYLSNRTDTVISHHALFSHDEPGPIVKIKIGPVHCLTASHRAHKGCAWKCHILLSPPISKIPHHPTVYPPAPAFYIFAQCLWGLGSKSGLVLFFFAFIFLLGPGFSCSLPFLHPSIYPSYRTLSRCRIRDFAK